MLSRLFNSARNIFNPTSRINQNNKSSTRKATTAGEEMVTTRGQVGNIAEEFSGGESRVLEVPISSRKRQRKTKDDQNMLAIDDHASVTPTKRQKILPVRGKDDNGPYKKSRAVVEIPVAQHGQASLELADMKREKLQKVGKEIRERDFSAQNSEESEVEEAELEILDSESDELSDVSNEVINPIPISSNVKRVTKTTSIEAKSPDSAKRHKQRSITTSRMNVSGISPKSAQPKHKRFESEEPNVESFPTNVEKAESDDESSGDDAPEIVGTVDALRSARSKARDAAKAVEEQESATRKRRKDRDAVLKQQAESARKKRKRITEVNEALLGPMSGDHVVIETLKSSEGKNVHDGKNEVVDNEYHAAIEHGVTTTAIKDKSTSTFANNRASLPYFLPDEYLQDDGTKELNALETEEPIKISKKMKFTDLVEKRPKDRRKGSTTYRVSEVRSNQLPPKSSFQARSTKESWLAGRPGKILGGYRKPFSGGFFRRKN